jgi:hypothetical protein
LFDIYIHIYKIWSCAEKSNFSFLPLLIIFGPFFALVDVGGAAYLVACFLFGASEAGLSS